MPLDTFVAGSYSGTYNAVDVGICTGDGYDLETQTHGELINDTDRFGESAVELVDRGVTHFMNWTSKAYKAGSLTPFFPWRTRGQINATATPIGRLGSNVALAMVLTAVANTPAAAAPATLTASKAILAPGSNLKLMYTSKVRNVPVRLLLLPYDAGGGTTTAYSET